MIPVSLTLKGFLSYKDEAVVDLSPVEVACVSGSNGAGKSSLFDAMTWALFGRARRNDDALINDASDGCSVAFVFDYEGNRYRILREKPRGKGALLEFQVMTAEGAWKPLTEAGLRATEDRIRDVLRLDYDTFINASFFLQGKADMFTQQAPARRKEILSSILGLEVWESYREEAALRRRTAGEEVKGLRGWLSEVEEELGQESGRVERLTLLTQNLKAASALRGEKEAQFLQAQSQAQALRAEAEKLAILEKNLQSSRDRRDALASRAGELTDELASFQRTLAEEKAIQDRHDQWLDLRKELERWNDLSQKNHKLSSRKSELATALSAEKARLEQEVEGLRRLQQEVGAGATRLIELQRQLADLQAILQKNEKELALLPGLNEKSAEAQKKQGELSAENRALRVQMDDLRQRMTDLESLKGDDCPLCGQELTLDHKKEILEKYNAEGTQLGDQYRANEQARKELASEIDDMAAEAKRLQSLSDESANLSRQAAAFLAQIEDLKTRQSEWQQKDAPRLVEIEKTLLDESYLSDERRKLAYLDEELKALGYDEAAHAHVSAEESRLRVVESEFQVLEKARTSVAGITRELTALEADKAGLEEEVKSQSVVVESMRRELSLKQEGLLDMQKLESDLENLRLEENNLRGEVGRAQQMVDVLEAQRRRKADLTGQIEVLNRRVAQLKMLETAFGKDGVPALLIEQALPEIEMQANELLDRLSDGRMSISFATEREFKDKKREDKRQTLDILISDATGSREYELFSGGEAFRINFAIRLALSRVLAGRAGARLQTLVIDEGFGSQDAEGRQRLIEAINLVSRDFAKILVITHLDELKDAFPSRIEVTKDDGGSRVEVIA